MTIPDFHEGFRRHFPNLGRPSQFIDPLLTVIGGPDGVHIDVIALDEALQVPDGQSTRDVVEDRYGQAALAFVLSCM